MCTLLDLCGGETSPIRAGQPDCERDIIVQDLVSTRQIVIAERSLLAIRTLAMALPIGCPVHPACFRDGAGERVFRDWVPYNSHLGFILSPQHPMRASHTRMTQGGPGKPGLPTPT